MNHAILRSATLFAVGSVTGLAGAQTVFGVTTSNRLVSFDAASPTQLLSNTAFSGLDANDLILGIDFRPATGELYAMGSSNRLYKVASGTGAATMIGSPFSNPLSGQEFGFDFNPTVDRIRVTSTSGQNMRLNPVTGAVAGVDTALAYAGGDPNAGQSPYVAGSAYTNNVAGATSTVLYDIDSDLDILVTQIPPNNGTLNTVGSLGVNVSSLVGFDILGAGDAYAALTREGDFRSALYRINLATGAATYSGAIGADLFQIRDIAVVPEPGTMIGLGMLAILARRRRRV